MYVYAHAHAHIYKKNKFFSAPYAPKSAQMAIIRNYLRGKIRGRRGARGILGEKFIERRIHLYGKYKSAYQT